MDMAQQLAHQYGTSQNLAVRIDVHERFSTNPYRWMRWVFDHFDLPEPCRILELGCGVGNLWMENADRIRPTWAITLSDFSAAMLAKTKANLADAIITTFNLDTGYEILARHFARVQVDKQANMLHITDPEALTAFCLSITRSALPDQSHPAFATYVAQHVQAHGGTLQIAKDAGLFVAMKG